ncbi:hypothetical protein [Gluconacetobacter entanii]|uniref:hypothetical protein n=1 Tax=Gluconacetobacter entanii TaxID=108528 RepID=UPI00142E12AA|nr:hypothetical protein [Gluconacetobacter entanii]
MKNPAGAGLSLDALVHPALDPLFGKGCQNNQSDNWDGKIGDLKISHLSMPPEQTVQPD